MACTDSAVDRQSWEMQHMHRVVPLAVIAAMEHVPTACLWCQRLPIRGVRSSRRGSTPIPRRATRKASCAQVLGHSKTCFVLLGSWLFLGENITVRQLGGMVLAISGMVGYGIASSKYAAFPLYAHSLHFLRVVNLPHWVLVNVIVGIG